jgi:phosphoribosylanthranilate isomerase
MNYPFILKFTSITNLSDARYAAGAWADFAGFCFDPSLPEYLEPQKAKEIAGWINGPLLTGEFGFQPVEWIQDFAKALSLHAVQVPANYKEQTWVCDLLCRSANLCKQN